MADETYTCPVCREVLHAIGPSLLRLQIAEHFSHKHGAGPTDTDGLTAFDRQVLSAARVRWNPPEGWGEIKDCPA